MYGVVMLLSKSFFTVIVAVVILVANSLIAY